MDTEFVSLVLSRRELIEVTMALAQRVMLEDQLREEKGLEPAAQRPLLEKVREHLDLAPELEERGYEALDEELWEHAWYTFTDEWAWFRAKQEIEREKGNEIAQMEDRRVQRLIEARYKRDFEKFVKEVEMHDHAEHAKRRV